ncbi:MAG: 3-methyl-2-oxobutanoate hydroxymethyltransferase [Verrucomicrobiota bacterium]
MNAPHPLFQALWDKVAAGQRLAALTAYDYPMARLLDEAGIDLLLVGDSLGMVVLGYPDTTSVTLPEMIHHTKAVARGRQKAVLVSDLPYRSYETPEQALGSARQLLEAGADAVKLEGGLEKIEIVEHLTSHGIPLVGHIGMLPQKIQEEGRYRKKGRTPEGRARILADAQALQRAGVGLIVVESVLKRFGSELAATLTTPLLGIGAGPDTAGQILVLHDLLGASPWFVPPFATPRAQLAQEVTRAVKEFRESLTR